MSIENSELTPLIPVEGLGTFWNFEIPKTIDQKNIQKTLQNEIINFNNLYSRFDPKSIVYFINTKKSLQNPSIELKILINIGKLYFQKTNGIFNFLLEKKLVDLGYGNRKIVETENELPNPINDIEINDNKIILRNGGIDFGGFGKGFLIDKLSNILEKKFRLSEFIINGGGDIFHFSLSNQPRVFQLQNPLNQKESIGEIKICNESLTSSSTYIRNWKKDNRTNNHLINPTTGKPVNNSGVFVISKNATMADIWATTISIASKEQISTLYESKEFEFMKIIDNKSILSKNFLVTKI